jgi:bifunctional DNA-binding transcriptional regulator/antitoxin component of YhaV-PrlF toxin-antitoxin module
MGTKVWYLSLDRKGRATLPEEVRTALGLRPGDFVPARVHKTGGRTSSCRLLLC